jgi:hypothetical protein
MITLAHKPRAPHVLYHVSPASRDSIATRGLLPEMARGKLKAVWLCTRDMIVWSIAHVALRHDVTIGSIFVYECHIDDVLVKRSAWPGIYYVKVTIPARLFASAAEIVAEPELEIHRRLRNDSQ